MLGPTRRKQAHIYTTGKAQGAVIFFEKLHWQVEGAPVSRVKAPHPSFYKTEVSLSRVLVLLTRNSEVQFP